MNIIIDTFGKNVKVTKADKVLIEKYLFLSAEDYEKQRITWLKVITDTTTGGVELWATQYCKDCFIIEPKESAERVKSRLQNGLEYYN